MSILLVWLPTFFRNRFIGRTTFGEAILVAFNLVFQVSLPSSPLQPIALKKSVCVFFHHFRFHLDLVVRFLAKRDPVHNCLEFFGG